MSGIVGSKFNIRGSGLVGSLGTDGQHMLSAGAGKTNVFETVGGGAVLQVKAVEFTGTASNTSTSPAALTDFNIAFTPTASSSKLFLELSLTVGMPTVTCMGYFYDSTGSAIIGPIADTASARSRYSFGTGMYASHVKATFGPSAWFTPGDTTTRTIQVFMAAQEAQVIYVNRNVDDGDNNTIHNSRGASTFTITEYDGSIVTIA